MGAVYKVRVERIFFNILPSIIYIFIVVVGDVQIVENLSFAALLTPISGGSAPVDPRICPLTGAIPFQHRVQSVLKESEALLKVGEFSTIGGKSFNKVSTFSEEFSTIFGHFLADFQQFISNTTAITEGYVEKKVVDLVCLYAL
jgi:hypothetical protein